MQTFLTRAWNAAKNAVLAFFRRRDPAEYFIVLVAVSVCIFLIRCICAGSEAFTEVFHMGCADLFMDFFHSVRDAAQGAGAYTERHVMYPPMANLFLWLISRLVPAEYCNTPKELAATWRDYPGAILSLILFFLFTFFALTLTLQREPYGRKKCNALTFAVLFSFPLIFVLERANTVFLVLVFMLIYMQNYDSDNKVSRELGLLSLAFAASMKLYPALLGVLLLADKRYKEALRCTLYAFLMFLIPSFFFGGPIGIGRAIADMFAYSHTPTLPYWNFWATHGGMTMGKIVLYTSLLFLFFAFGLSSLLPRRKFMTYLFFGSFCMMFPSIFSTYNWLLFLPALLIFFRTEKLEGINWLYFVCLTIPFCMYIVKWCQDNILFTCNIILMLLCLTDSVRSAVDFSKKRKDCRSVSP